MADRIDEVGYLSDEAAQFIEQIRAGSADWFTLAEDVNVALIRSVTVAMGRVKTGSMQPEAVAVRIVLRAC